MTGRASEACGCDPAADRWAIAIWAATAGLGLCLYHYREEGAYDSGGRWRRRRIRHWLVGRPANLVRAAAMAEHFCGLAREGSRAAFGAGAAHARRSFQSAFAERLSARLRAALAEAEASLEGEGYAEEKAANRAARAAEGIDLPRDLGGYDKTGRDRSAVRQGRAAADNVSLVLRTPLGRAARVDRSQMALPF